METILEGTSGAAISAATAGFIVAPANHLKSSDPRNKALLGWLAVARVAVLEIWADRRDLVESESRSNFCLVCEADMGRIAALAAVPVGNGEEDNIIVVKESLAWELLRLIACTDSPIVSSTYDCNKMSGKTALRRIRLSLVASGSFSSSPVSPIVPREELSAPTVLMSVRGSRGVDLAAEEYSHNRKLSPETLVACAWRGSLIMMVFPHKDERIAGPAAMETAYSTLSTTSDSRWECEDDTIVGDAVRCAERRISPRRQPPGTPTVFDVVILCREVRESRVVIAVLLDESGEVSEAAQDGIKHLTVRTYQWEPNGPCVLVPGDWCIAHLHLGTHIAALVGGGLLCVGRDGARIFHKDGEPLLDAVVQRRIRAGFKLDKFTKCSWGAKSLTVLTPAITSAWLQSTPAIGGRESGVQDFLAADVDGELHRISVVSDFSGINEPPKDSRAPRENSTVRTGDHTSIERMTTTRIRRRDISAATSPPLPGKMNFLLTVGSRGFIFASSSSPSSAVIVRITPGPYTESLRRNESWQTANIFDFTRDHPLLWHINTPTEPLGDIFGAVRDFATVDVTSGPILRRASLARNGTWPCAQRNAFREASTVTTLGLARFEPHRAEGLKAVAATGEEQSGIQGGGAHPTAGLCTLEHGLGLLATVEVETDSPQGCSLFAQSLTASHVGETEHELGKTMSGHHPIGRVAEAERVIRNVFLFSDRVRSRTHVMAVWPDGESMPIVTEKGFDLDQHTVYLGRTEPEGFIVQVTEKSVNVLEPKGLLCIGHWHPPPSLPRFKAQFGASTGSHVAIVWEGTMVVLAMKATHAAEAIRRAEERVVREVKRAELGYPASAMAMSTASCTYDSTVRGESVALAESALIAVSFWDRPSIAVFSWTPPLAKDASNSFTGVQGDGLLEEIATWCPTYERTDSAAIDACEAPEIAGARVNVVRALAFMRSGKGRGRLQLVAGTADGVIAIADWQENSEDDQSQKRLGMEWSGFEKLVTIATFQVGRGPVRLDVFERNPINHFDDIGENNESVFVNSDDMDAVLRYCPDKGESSNSTRGVWRCTQVCKAGFSSRQSVVSTPHSKLRIEDNTVGEYFAWLTTAKHLHRERFDVESSPGSGRSVMSQGSDIDGNRRGNEEVAFGGLLLCLGKLDWESRGRFQKKSLLQTPTHLLYVPVTRSIVVACLDHARRKAGSSFPNDDPGSLEPMQPTLPSLASSLRVFDADTLDERPGGPLHLHPGIRVTGLATLGLNEQWKVPVWTATARNRDRKYEDIPSAAVGGDIIAVACCYDDHDGHPRGVNGEFTHMSAVSIADFDDPTTLKTVVAAFEVVAYTDQNAEGNSTGRKTDDTGMDNVSKTCTFGRHVGHTGITDSTRGSTSLESLAASTAMAGACFSLETIDCCFVAMALDDNVLVLGWSGRKGGLRPDRPTPPLRLELVSSCRTSSGGCVTALGTCGTFIAVAEFLHSVSVFSFDHDSRTLSLVAAHSRNNLVVAALALSFSPCSSTGKCPERHRILTIALADRTTGTVAVLSCPAPKPVREGSEGEKNRAKRCSESCHGGCTNCAACNNGWRLGSQSAGVSDSAAKQNDILPYTEPLRMIAVWRCPETVTRLKSLTPKPFPNYCSQFEQASICGEADDGGLFLLGTAAGTLKTVTVGTPRCCLMSGKIK